MFTVFVMTILENPMHIIESGFSLYLNLSYIKFKLVIGDYYIRLLGKKN